MTNFEKALKHFQETPFVNKQIGNYFIENGILKIKKIHELNYKLSNIRYQNSDQKLDILVEILAMKVGEYFLGNSSLLRSLTSRRNRWNRVETEEQRIMSEIFSMVPFNAFKDAGLDIKKLKVVESGPTETLVRSVEDGHDKKGNKLFKDVKVHFTGAKLLEIEGKYFLFDVDRNEIKHKIFNPFIVQLLNPAKTIKDAYEDLKPEIVKKALADGKKVLRQGEWFFIPVKPSKEFVERNFKKQKDWRGKMIYPEMRLQAGRNRPNYGKFGFTDGTTNFVKGNVRHSGREHKDLELKGWHVAIPNTSVTSWSVTGEID